MKYIGFITCVSRIFEKWYGAPLDSSVIDEAEKDLKDFGVISRNGAIVDMQDVFRFFSLPVDDSMKLHRTPDGESVKDRFVEILLYEGSSVNGPVSVYLLGNGEGFIEHGQDIPGGISLQPDWKARYAFKILAHSSNG